MVHKIFFFLLAIGSSVHLSVLDPSTSLAQSELTSKQKVGVILPLSGPSASMGESLSGALKLADANSISLLFEDDQCEAKKALAAYYKLKAEGVHVYFLACSGSILALAPVVKKDGGLILTSYAGSAAIRKTGDEVIRFNPDAFSIAEALREYLTATEEGRNLKRLALLYEEQDYAVSLASLLRESLAERIVSEEVYPVDQSSYKSQILRLTKKNPDAILMVPVSDVAAQVIYKEMRETKLNLQLLGDVNLCDYKIKPSDYGIKGKCFSAQMTGREYEIFRDDYQKRYGRAPQYPFYDAIGYDIILMINQIKTSTPWNSEQGIKELKAAILGGIQGKMASYSFSENGEVRDGWRYLKLVSF